MSQYIDRDSFSDLLIHPEENELRNESYQPRSSLTSNQEGGDSESFKVDKIRWLILMCFFVSGSANALVLVTWSPIISAASTYFGGIGNTSVNLLTVCFQIMYLPGTILAVNIMKISDLRRTMMFGGFLTTLGCAVRYIGAISQPEISPSSSYGIVLIGTLFAALAQPFYLNMPARLATAWFGVSERGIVSEELYLFAPALSLISPSQLRRFHDDL